MNIQKLWVLSITIHLAILLNLICLNYLPADTWYRHIQQMFRHKKATIYFFTQFQWTSWPVKMFLSKSDNLYCVLKPIHFSLKLTAVTSFSIQQEKGKFIAKVSFFNIFWIFLSTLSCILSSFLFIDFHNEWKTFLDQYKSSDILKWSTSFLAISFLYATILTNWLMFCHRKIFVLIFNKFQEVDKVLNAFDLRIESSKQRKIVSRIILLMVSIAIINILFTYFFLLKQMKRTVCFSLVIIWIFLWQWHFSSSNSHFWCGQSNTGTQRSTSS